MFTTVSPSSRTPYPACNQHSVTLVTRTKRHIAEGFLEAARWFPHSLCTLSLFPGESPHLLPGPFRGKPTALSQNMRTKELVKEDLVHRDEESFLNITFFFSLIPSPCVPAIGSPVKACPTLRLALVLCLLARGLLSQKAPEEVGAPHLPAAYTITPHRRCSVWMRVMRLITELGLGLGSLYCSLPFSVFEKGVGVIGME